MYIVLTDLPVYSKGDMEFKGFLIGETVLVAAETVNLIGVKYATNTSPVSSLS
jgi:hypothetical protein